MTPRDKVVIFSKQFFIHACQANQQSKTWLQLSQKTFTHRFQPAHYLMNSNKMTKHSNTITYDQTFKRDTCEQMLNKLCKAKDGSAKPRDSSHPLAKLARLTRLPSWQEDSPACRACRRTHPLAELAGAAKVDDLDGAALGVAEEDVLGLEVAVDDAELGRREEEQRGAELLRKLARQVERHAAEVGVAQEVVEVVGEQLKDEAEVLAEHEVALQSHCAPKHRREFVKRMTNFFIFLQFCFFPL